MAEVKRKTLNHLSIVATVMDSRVKALIRMVDPQREVFGIG